MHSTETGDVVIYKKDVCPPHRPDFEVGKMNNRERLNNQD